MRKHLLIWHVLILLCLLVMTHLPVQAQQAFYLPARPMPRHHVNDFAGQLSPREVDTLEQLLIQINHERNADIVLVTVSDAGIFSPEDYADTLYSFWHLGEDNGQRSMLMLVDFGMRRVVLKVGDGLKGTITAETNFMLMNHYVLPAFQRGQYYAGIKSCLEAIHTILISPRELNRMLLANRESPHRPWWVLIIGLAVIVGLLVFWKANIGRKKA
ncbi:MAG: TPM domain-containing protein [Thermoflavifilum sp.]|nr:TPM domain-containing protein [Thermoflavifilum sp.]